MLRYRQALNEFLALQPKNEGAISRRSALIAAASFAGAMALGSPARAEQSCGGTMYDEEVFTCVQCGGNNFILDRFVNGNPNLPITYSCCDDRWYDTANTVCHQCGSVYWLLDRFDGMSNEITWGCCGTGDSDPFDMNATTCKQCGSQYWIAPRYDGGGAMEINWCCCESAGWNNFQIYDPQFWQCVPDCNPYQYPDYRIRERFLPGCDDEIIWGCTNGQPTSTCPGGW
jgi:hypothetical protein